MKPNADRVSLILTTYFLSILMFCVAAQAAPHNSRTAEKSLSKVCGVTVPASIEQATSYYLLPITAMAGDVKPLCRLWQEVNPADVNSMTLWNGVVAAVLLQAMAQQSNIAPYRALIGRALVLNPAQINRHPWLKTVDVAREAVYFHIKENTLLARNWTPKELSNHLQSRAPDVAATLQKAYEKWDDEK